MLYPAVIRKEGKYVLAEFPDCPGCQTFAEPGEDIEAVAAEALYGWLEAHFAGGDLPPAPSKKMRAPKGAAVRWIPVPLRLAVKLVIRRSRQERKLTQAQLAKLAGVSQPMVAKLEQPGSNPSLETIEKVAAALGAVPDFDLRPADEKRA